MQFTAYLTVSVIVLLKSLSVRGCFVPKYSDFKRTRCFIDSDADGTEQDLETKTTWTVVDATEGTVLIQFPFLNSTIGKGYSKCPTSYELSLRVKDGQHFLKHSKHDVLVTKKENSYICNKMANVIFTHMFTGTYELRIKVGCSCLVDDTILIKNITTNYKKKEFAADDAVGTITAKHKRKEVTFTMNVDTSMEYTLKYTNSCSQDCIKAPDSRPVCHWKVIDGVEQRYNNCIVNGCDLIEGPVTVCYWRVKYPKENDTETLFCGGKVKGQYSSKGNIYKITAQNVSTGCYCITAQKWDSRLEDKLWRNLCQRAHSPFVYVNTDEKDGKSPVGDTTFPVPLIVILGIVVITLPVTMWMLWKYLSRRIPANEKPKIVYHGNVHVLVDYANTEILLLYPRDCEPFMKLMKQFKELLKTTCKCEVLDYYDQEHSTEIDREGSSWLLKKINSPETKIILVESVCSVLCQKAHFSGVTIKPIIQHSRDNFFALALVELTLNKHTVFVIRFNNNLAEDTSLKCISRDVRYVMPYQLRKLVATMGFYISEDEVQIDKEMEMALTNNINGFIKYTNDNNNYIMDLYKKC